MVAQLERFTWSGSKATFEEDSRWFDELRTELSPSLRSAIERLGGAEHAWGPLCGLAVGDPDRSDPHGLMSRIEDLPARELRMIALGSHVTSLRDEHGPLMERAADGDQGAVQRLLEVDPYCDEGKLPAFRRLFSLDPEQAKALTLEVLARWHREVFAPRKDEIERILQRDAEAKRSLSAAMSQEELVDRATNGLQYTPQPHIRRVLLVPHLAMRPWNLLNEWEDTFVVCYPVSDESLELDRADPPARLVRLYRALDDPKRLRILKLLARGPAGLQEIADHIGVAKSTAHHHLVILRAAGLTKVGTEPVGRYSLRMEMIGEVSGWLAAFLGEARER
jgi:DNA-binding transcriptional ArsR family regulator